MLKALRTEYRVITEALCPTPLCGYLTIDDTLEEMFLLDAAAAAGTDVFLLDKGDDGAEACLTIIFILELAQEARHVCLAIVTGSTRLHTGVAGAIDARSTIQGFYFEPRVIGKAVNMIVIIDISGFLQGILFQCLSCLRDIHITADIFQG